MQRDGTLRLTLVLGLLTTGFGLGRLGPWAPPTDRPQDAIEVARGLSTAFQGISRRIGPSVVQVKAYSETRGRWRPRQDGSGVIVRADGVVVTNYHVVRGSDVFRAVFTDGRVREATIIGTDDETDLAVLRLQGDGPFPHTSLDVDTDAHVGEIVLAMGNPMGLGHTVTQGIVSGTGRTDLQIATYEDFIQTDAVINPGNSGGPLIDLDGRVLGINTAVGLASNGDDGIAFAIPSRMVAKVLADILRDGYVRRGWLGVEPYDRRALRARRSVGYEGVSRVKIARFPEDSPARAAGLRVDDVIERIDGRRVITNQDLLNIVAETHPGAEVAVEVWREGEVLTIPVRLSERE